MIIGPYLLTVIVPVGRYLNILVYTVILILQILINIYWFGFENIDPTFVKSNFETILCFYFLNHYLDSSNRSEFLSFEKKI